jgi:hypothetical protein
VLDPAAIPDVEPDEILARFVHFKRHVRSFDSTVRPDAFIPHPHADLSVTRHREATADELWNDGRRIATIRQLPLYGRADTSVTAFASEGLRTESDPILPENPNHAVVTGWPSEKSEQKIKAAQIAIKSQYLPAP